MIGTLRNPFVGVRGNESGERLAPARQYDAWVIVYSDVQIIFSLKFGASRVDELRPPNKFRSEHATHSTRNEMTPCLVYMTRVRPGRSSAKVTSFRRSFDANLTEGPIVEDPSEMIGNLLAVTAAMASQLWDHDTKVDSVLESNPFQKKKTIDTVRH